MGRIAKHSRAGIIVEPTTRPLISIVSGAKQANFSVRHFRRLVEDAKLPIIQLGHKFFLRGPDFNALILRNKEQYGS